MPCLRVRRAGLLTTVQDAGRWGYQAFGVPVAGAMDAYSHALANRLVANAPDAATLEVTLSGPEIAFESAALVAVTGADFDVSVDGRPMPMHTSAWVTAGACLSVGERRRGARAYIAVAGGILVQPWLGSRSTHLLSRTGGHEGRALRSGDRLMFAEPSNQLAAPGRSAPALALPWDGARVRVLPGPHQERFGKQALQELAECRFRVSPRSDRMGYRLEGAAPMPTQATELLSASMPNGAVQILPSGEPILLMADRATSGGYPVLGTVMTADLPLAGQLAPGDWIEFSLCSLAEAAAALQTQQRALGQA